VETLGLNHCLLLSALLFGIGAIGVLTRRNIIMVLMCLELMFNAANINLVAVARFRPMFRNSRTVNIDEIHLLKG